MKKGCMFAALVMSAVMLLTGCGKEKETNNDNDTRVSGKASFEKYIGVEYEKAATEVSDEEVQRYLDSFVNEHAEQTEVTDRDDVQKGDVVNIDYTGYMDGVAFENGAATDYDLTIGSGQFIPGFEDGLIGAKKGSTVDVEVTFPDPYKNNPDFAGKPATFTVTVNKISTETVPELTDALVAEHTEYETVEDYKKYIRSNLQTQKNDYALTTLQVEVMRNLVESATFEGIEQSDIDDYYESQYNYYNQLAEVYKNMYGYDFNTFMYYFFNCTSEEEYKALLKENAEFEVKKSLVLYEVIERENLKITEEEYEAALAEYAGNYGVTVEEFKKQIDEAGARDMVLMEKAEELIYNSAVAIEAE